ncbi:MAG: hypothetical protein Q4B78_04970 [Bacillota bacterium]|nr:hypothetical protein [Bacillota bacterium]
MSKKYYDYCGNVCEILDFEYEYPWNLQVLISDVNCVDSYMWIDWKTFYENAEPVEIEPEPESPEPSTTQLKVRVGNGWLVADATPDSDYPGIDIEYVADSDEGLYTRPRVLVEWPKDGEKLRCLVWNRADVEDYTEEIELTNCREEK